MLLKQPQAQKIVNETKLVYDQIAVLWSASRQELWSYFKRFLDYVPAGSRVLDAGCGNGRLVKLFETVKVDYTGLDFSQELISLAKKNFSDKKFLVGNLLKLPFDNNSFDVVFCLAALHHLPSTNYRRQALTELQRVLKPGGSLILINWYWNSTLLRRLLIRFTITKFFGLNKLDWGDIYVPFGQAKIQRYVHLFNRTSLKKQLEKIGFDVVENQLAPVSPRGYRSLVTIAKKC